MEFGCIHLLVSPNLVCYQNSLKMSTLDIDILCTWFLGQLIAKQSKEEGSQQKQFASKVSEWFQRQQLNAELSNDDGNRCCWFLKGGASLIWRWWFWRALSNPPFWSTSQHNCIASPVSTLNEGLSQVFIRYFKLKISSSWYDNDNLIIIRERSFSRSVDWSVKWATNTTTQE